MAKEVIEHGDTHVEHTCSNCGCVFTFDGVDTYWEGYLSMVDCPECNHPAKFLPKENKWI